MDDITLRCEFCNCENDTVEIMENPYNDCEEIALCEICYENATDNVTFY